MPTRSPTRSVAIGGVLALLCQSLPVGVAVAELLPFEGTLEFQIGSLDPIVFAAIGSADLTGTSALPRVGLAAELFVGNTTQFITDPVAAPFRELRADVHNDAGLFSRPSGDGAFGGAMPMRGVAKLCLFAACDEAPLANLSVPLSAIGRTDVVAVSGVVNMTVQGAPWTTAPAAPISTSVEPFPLGGVGGGSATLHARLVAPIFIRTNLPAIAEIHGAGFLEFQVGAGCSDAIDNDADGVVDSADPGCSSATDPSELSNAECDDGWDLDGDGRSDYPEDPGCESLTDVDETNFYACNDGIDNDGDGRFDFRSSHTDTGCRSPLDDSERTTRYACDDGDDDDGDLLVDMEDADCSSPSDPSERPGIECGNGLDDDDDGAIDFPADSGCSFASDQNEAEVCSNGRDDDEDGAIDFPADIGCTGPYDSEETQRNLLLPCDNGLDDDGDLLRDLADPGCTSAADPVEGPNDNCRNGLDDDLDGLIDFPSDPGCSAADDPIEYAAETACDDGRDNDGDGVRDFLYSGATFIGDPGCASPGDTSELSALACDNGIDDDGDGAIDWSGNDRGCSSRTDDSERGADECDNGIDDDADGLTDFPSDPNCSNTRDTTEEIDCNDGEDDDGDGLADYPDDPGCASAQDESERGTSTCDNGADDDQDRLIDSADPGCANPLDSSERGTLVCDDEIDQDGDGQAAFRSNQVGLNGPNTLLHDLGCTSALDPDETRANQACDDGLDNDSDGLIDFAESHCRYEGDAFGSGWGYSAQSELDATSACDDGFDNDGDGRIDHVSDPGCTDPQDPSERSATSACDDGADNDGDGAIDNEDPGCPFPEATLENPTCDDGVDNNGNGLVDFNDPACTRTWPYWEETPSCGLGVELAGLIPLASWLHGRRRRPGA